MSEMFNRQAEAMTLAGVLRNPDLWFRFREMGLGHKDFGGPRNRSVMQGMELVAEQRGQPEMTLLIETLRGLGRGDDEEYIQQLMVLPCSPAQAQDSARIVKGLTVSRGLAEAGVKIIEIAQEKRSDYEAALVDAESALRGVRVRVPAVDQRTDPASILAEWRGRGIVEGIEVQCLPRLQTYTGGLLPGHIWVIGGFSSTGKTAFGCNLVVDALNQDKWVGIVSTEMTSVQYMIRLIALKSGVPQLKVRDQVMLNAEDSAAIKRAEAQLADAPLRIYDTVYNLEAIRSTALRQKQMLGLDLLLVDFVQNVKASTGDFSFADLTETIIDLQALAKDLNCTVIAFSQVSNQQAFLDSQGEREVYSFKGSGALKDAADVAIMLRRDRVNRSAILEVDVVKHRHGENGKFNAHMTLETGRIEESYE